MSYSISTSHFSFVQFEETDQIVDCEYTTQEMCLPVYNDDDVWFQFVITADTEEESGALCEPGVEPITLGLVENCGDGYLIEFSEKPTRYRISPLKILYVWQQGLPNFQSVIDEVDMCFHIMISMPEINDQTFCSNCFQRIGESCHTSVIEYSNEENSFDFNYCAGEDLGNDSAECEPTIIQFTNQATMTIPWTAFLQARYGSTPNVQIWTYNNNGELEIPGISVRLDAYPPTELRIDFGGNNSGIIKIM